MMRRFIVSGGLGRVVRAVFLVAGFSFAAILLPVSDGHAQALESFAVTPLVIVTGTARHSFTVEIAGTEARRAQGLMFRRILAPDRGMLFIYPSDRIITMWMKNTLIPLDMLFLAADGRVVSLHERAVPGSLVPIGSGVRARAVVELPGGTVSRLGIQPGDRVLNDGLGNSEQTN